MQHCSVLVARGGDLTNTVLRENVSVPEIGVLISLHGIDGILRVPGTTSEKAVKHLEEYDRIANIYGVAATTAILGQRVFNIALPTRLSAVFADVADEPEDAEQEEPAKAAPKRGIKLAMKAEETSDLLTD